MSRIVSRVLRVAGLFAIGLIFCSAASGAIAVDATASGNQGTAKTTVATAAFSTTSANELLLAFISADSVKSPNTTVTGVSGGGLTWVLVQRTNVQSGTAEVWRAFATTTLTNVTVTATLSQSVCSSITVMSFSGVDTSGTNGSGAIGAIGTGNANPGAPTATLVTTRNGSLLVGVGADWDRGAARTVGSGQAIVHQYLAPVGDTYWVQVQSSPTMLSGTSVTINDTAPTNDRYDMSIAEVLPVSGGGTSGSISGTITPAANGNGATVTLSQGGTTVATTTAGTNGSYSFASVPNGAYVVTPSRTGFTFSPASQNATVNGNAVVVPAFTATATTGTISGTITPAANGNGATVTLSQGGTTVATTTAGANGSYSFANVPNGTYVVTPSATGFTFSPTSQNATVNGNAVVVPAFTATATTGTISGTITPAANGNGATVTLSQSGTTIATTAAGTNGSYSFAGVLNGTYTVTPSSAGFTFSPASQNATVNGNTVVVPAFTATATTGTISGTITPAANGNGATVTLSQGTTTGAMTTAGANGSYSFTSVPNGTYVVTPSLTGFTFSPASQNATVNGNTVTVPAFTASALTWSVTGTISPAGAGVGTNVTLSQNTATIATVAGNSSGNYSFTNVSNGTYTVTPSNASYTFSPTSQSITVSNGNFAVPVFTATPVPTWSISGTITPPATANGALITLSGAANSTTNADVNGNYTFPNLLNGTYLVTPSLTGFTFNPTSQSVTVSGANATAPNFVITANPTWNISGTITPAANGSGATVTLSGGSNATTTSDVNGSYTFGGITNGTYTVTPTKSGFTFTPPNQSVTVSGADPASVNFTAQSAAPPPAPLKIDVTVFQDQSAASATVTTPAFSTTSGNELLLAFVGSDYQPSQSSANILVNSVSGGGLTWQLVKRTNAQLGTAEIWRAFAPTVLSNVTVTATLSQRVQSSLTVMSFSGVDTSGTNGSGAIGATVSSSAASGGPTAKLVTTRNNSWVLGVGNDYDNAVSRTVGTGQTLVHQYLAPINDTYWVQRQTSATPLSGTNVTINDTAPTGDRYNLSVVEVLPILSQGPVADLTVGKTHAGNFVQGQSGASYTITANNIGAGATSGTVTVTDTLPAGLTATSISGPNWNCTLTTLVCTRTDVLAGGASYPAITLTVNVASNAPSSVTNTVAISGGGETNTSNDTASDLTNITVPTSSALTHVGGAAAQPVITNQVMTFNYSPVGTNDALVVLAGCRSAGITGMSLTAPGWNFTPISGLVGPSSFADFISTFGAIVPNTSPVTFTVTLTGGNGNCTNNDTTVLVDEFSGNDITGGTTTFDAHNESLDNGTLGICTGAPVIPVNNNDAIWYGCFDNVTAVSGGYTKGQDDAAGDWSEYQILSGGAGVAQNAGFITNPNFSSFGLGGVSIKAKPIVAVPDLTISKTHSGSFMQGQTGGTYSITVSNVGNAASSGTITVTDALPAGLTATGMSGTNWVCALATLTCTRNDALATGTSYPAITLTVNVASNAPASVTNSATVSGGGESNTSNDTASDVTSITASNSTPIKLIQSNVNGNENATSSMSVAFPSNVTAGNFLIVTGAAARPATTLSVSDTLGNTYTPTMGPVTDTTQNVNIYIWYVPVSKGGANTVTITPATTAALEIHVSEWTGLASASPVDQTASATGTGTSVSSGAKATTANGELVFGYGWVLNTATAGTGFTPISLVNGDLDEYEIQANAGSAAATFTQTSGTWFAAMATFKPAAGGPAPPTISLTSPASGATVSSKTTVTANAADTSFAINGVQFLLDGANLGAQVTVPPYSLTWDTTTATAGAHTLSATVSDSGGLKTTAVPITVTVDNSGNSALVGSWSSAVSIPTVAVNLILLKDNTLLFYEDGASPTVWDYTNNIFTNISTAADLFCSGHAALADGRILAVGGYGNGSGNIGIANAEIFDPSKNTWTNVPSMAYKRWYPTATTLSDGRILVTAGWQTTNHTNAGIPEIYDPVANTWTQLTNANNPFETYPFLFMLSDGRVIHVGGSEYATNTDILDINAQTWTVVDSRIIDGGSATMYLPGKIMKAGSAADSQNTGPSSNTTFILDTTQPSPTWVQTPSMAYVRSFMNLTELPDGSVLATGGETDKNGGNIANAVYAAELWSPVTQTWTTMASMHTPREYHGTALLLPDGRVVESGMGADFGNVPDQMSAEFYSPPYLFKGPRPTITQSPAQVQYGTNFFVGTPDAASIQSAVLIRTGAVTHFFDQNTRYVPVTFQQTTGGLTVTAPASALLAPPGYYMLFLVNANGVPSIAPFVQVTP